jgi:hypothetical protein
LTGQSHFMMIFVRRKVTLPNRINVVPWMNAVTPTPYHECTQLAQKAFWLSWMKVTWRSQQTACIHGTELVWLRSFVVRSWSDRVFLRGFTQGSWFFQIRFYRSSAKLNNEQLRLKCLIISARSFTFLWINFCNKRQTNFWVATKIRERKKNISLIVYDRTQGMRSTLMLIWYTVAGRYL